jgi:TolB-like protein
VRTRGKQAVLVALALVVALAAGAMASRSWGPGPADPGKRLAVFPFGIHGGPPHAYLREGMVDLLSTKLDGAAGFHSIDPRSVVAAVAPDSAPLDPGTMRQAAEQLHARWYVTGDVLEVAGRLQINALLYDRSNHDLPSARATVAGDTAALFQLVDDLAGRVLAALTSGRDSTVTRLAAVTTHSLPALKAFLAGEQAMRAGRDAQAATAFRDAAALDTGFALAEYRLALSATWILIPGADDPAAWAARAARHAGRLPPLARDLLAAYDAYKGLNADSAEHLYLGLTSAHPDNVEAWFMLGETLFHYGPWRGRSPMAGWPAFERVLALDPGNAHAMIHLARLAATYGRYDALDSLVARYLDRYSGAERTAEMRALKAFARKDPAGIAAISRELNGADPVVATSVLQAVTLVIQDVDAGAALSEQVLRTIRPERLEVLLRRMTTDLPIAAGRFGAEARGPALLTDEEWLLETELMVAGDPFFGTSQDAIADLRGRLETLENFLPKTHLHPLLPKAIAARLRNYLLGLLSVRLGDLAAAERIASDLAKESRTRGDIPGDLAHGLQAELARSRGDTRAALAELEQFTVDPWGPGRPGASHWGIRERFLRAELLHALGRLEEALPWYESFVSMYDTPYMAPAHFRQGEIYRRLGNLERARFVTLWKDSDPALRPRVEQARAWLAKTEER